MGNTISLPTPESVHPPPIQPPDSPPHVLPAAMCLSESEGEKRAENMSDLELIHHVENKLRPVGEDLRSLIPFIQEARARFSCAGRRVPIEGQPSYTEWIHQTLGISDRHVRRLLAAARESTNSFPEDELEHSPKQQKHDETLWQACRIAHAILGLEESDERDPTGTQRKAALSAMAYQFLHEVRRKPIAIIVRAKPLQPADINGLCGVILTCFERQVDQVFGSLNECERSEAVRLFTEQIADRYNGAKADATLMSGEGTRR